MQVEKVIDFIVEWIKQYAKTANVKGYVIGVSGGIDSALVARLCAKTELSVLLLNMPIRQHSDEYLRAKEEIEAIKHLYKNVDFLEVDLTATFETFESTIGKALSNNHLAMANTRSRLRMLTLYAYAQQNGLLVAGTGNKIEDFGIGFFTKYGDGGVDVSPIGDLMKTEVYELARYLGVTTSILDAKPTDGLWDNDNHYDEAQIGATYPELEWAMNFEGDETSLTARQKEVLTIYRKFNRQNQHKMKPIPVCEIPDTF